MTQRAILAATEELLQSVDGATVSMRQIAEASGVSRQLLYLHFKNRADLLLKVSRVMDARARTPAAQARIDDAPDGLAALREAVAVQGHIKPRIHAVARTIDRLRHMDEELAAVWREREQARLDRCMTVIRRLVEEGQLADGWTAKAAAQLMWSATSLRAWEELVGDQGWSTAAWVRHTTTVLVAGLVRSTRV